MKEGGGGIVEAGDGEVTGGRRLRDVERAYGLTHPSVGVETIARDESSVLISQHPEMSNMIRMSTDGRRSLAFTVRART